MAEERGRSCKGKGKNKSKSGESVKQSEDMNERRRSNELFVIIYAALSPTNSVYTQVIYFASYILKKM